MAATNMTNSDRTYLSDITVEGYRFCRSDGQPFDSTVMTFVPPEPVGVGNASPRAVVFRLNSFKPRADDDYDFSDTEEMYHVCEEQQQQRRQSCPTQKGAAVAEPFVLAYRCKPGWDALSDQQRDVVEKIEDQVNAFRQNGVFFRSVIMEGLGGCGKTHLMAFVINHSPENTHVLYLTKQNKRLQDFIYDDLCKGEHTPPRPITDMSKCVSGDFSALADRSGGRYACSVEKMVYNVCGRNEACETNTRSALQWKMNIPDDLFTGVNTMTNKSNVVVFLDEYTMISPPLLHKMLHCVDQLFSAPTVLIMGGDRFQLGPIDWGRLSDVKYKDQRGKEAPPHAVTRNNFYYTSDVREELKKRLDQEPFEYQMVGSQRCRDDPHLAELVLYLRGACKKRTSVKAIERRLAEFGRSRGIRLYRYNAASRSVNCTGQLVFDEVTSRVEERNKQTNEDSLPRIDDEDDEDCHLGDDDLRDTSTIKVDWDRPPIVDMKPFIDFYAKLYESIYVGWTEGLLHDSKLPTFVYEQAAAFARTSFPMFIVKKNDKCNLLSDTFLKTLYNGVFTELEKKYAGHDEAPTTVVREDAERVKRMKLSTNPERGRPLGIRTFLERLCLSISVCSNSPVQQTMMVGVPYRMTDTLKSGAGAVISNGELVLLTAIEFSDDLSVKSVVLKTLQRNTDHFVLVRPGLTQNRLSFKNSGGRKSDTAYMLPMVPMVCENIYQMQGNTIVSDCYVDLLSTKGDDIYVAVSRFQKALSIRGIVLSK